MNKKKILKISGIVLGSIILLIIAIGGVAYYNYVGKYPQDKNKYPHYIGYINPTTSVLNDGFTLCDDEKIFGKHHGSPEFSFKTNKKNFRESVLASYNFSKYSDSGYLNFRFLVNCEGKAGRFEINELNLDLEKVDLNDDMVEELLTLTSDEKHWNIFYTKELPRNYYMYILYRIEDGKITEILP
ncbi:MAG: hypothetical protein HRT69_03255 [Flavobacteriaceae bacterium]|nr:hypothetical protein [Flavobacteriaceae bacterium]